MHVYWVHLPSTVCVAGEGGALQAEFKHLLIALQFSFFNLENRISY